MYSRLIKHSTALFFLCLFITAGSGKFFQLFPASGASVYTLASAEEPEENKNKEDKPQENTKEWYSFILLPATNSVIALNKETTRTITGNSYRKTNFYHKVPTPPPEWKS